MIFWFLVILTVIVIVVGIIAYENDFNVLCTVCKLIGICSGFIALIILVFIIYVQITLDGSIAANEQRYKALVYKAQIECIRDEFGIVNKEYIDEIQALNVYLAEEKTFSNNFWIGILYPKRKYEGLEFIDLESIKIKE